MTLAEASVVDLGDLRLGALLAEGGEGRVHELTDRPGTLAKLYRRPVAAGVVADLVSWPSTVAATDARLAARVATAAAWPSAVVAAGDGAMAAGVLLPRAPRRFSLRHRDGNVRLATLSYLTAPPGQRVAAYGLALPGRVSPERIGIVYALARLLEAFEAAEPAVGHGDLSTKNVLWSLERGPEVFVLDCDSAEHHGAVPVGPGDVRRRAMTPNWDDPAVEPGGNPTPASDRYSLALIFLRVVGAAHYPIQKRQRTGEVVHLDIDVPRPATRARSLDPGAPVWDLCERGLSAAAPDARPPAAEWVAALEQVLDDLGAMGTVRAVWAAQGGGSPAPTPPVPVPPGRRGPRDVVVTPLVSAAPERTYQRIRVTAPRGAPSGTAGAGIAAPGAPTAAAPAGPPPGGRRVFVPAPPGPPARSATPAAPPPARVGADVRAGLRRGARAWLRLHRAMLGALRTRGRRRAGVARLLGCAGLDVALAVVAVFIVAMLVGPLLNI